MLSSLVLISSRKMHVFGFSGAKIGPVTKVPNAVANQCTKSYHGGRAFLTQQALKEADVLRGMVLKISAGVLLIASTYSNGGIGSASPASAFSEVDPRALTIVTVGLIGALLADVGDEPTQDLAFKEAGDFMETEERVPISESSPTATGISAGS